MVVPNLFPKLEAPYRIAIVGEAPGRDEVASGQPFVGMSGRFLMALLSRAGLSRDALYIGNVCQHQPPNNDIASFRWDGDEIQSGLAQLTQDLRTFKPNICLLLGRTALKAAKDLSSHPLTHGKHWTHSIDDWRGSLFLPQDSSSPMFGFKCTSSYHPAAVLRQYSWAPLLQFDIKKTASHGSNPTLELPERKVQIGLRADEIIYRLKCELAAADAGTVQEYGTDIEGYWNGMTCFGIAPFKDLAYIIPLQCKDGSHYFNEDEEREVWFYLSRWLAHPNIHKVWQNGLYDRWCFQYGHQIPVFGNAEDIMLKHWELYCELEKSLATQVSLYTNQPFYKGDRKSNDDRTYWIYNGTDSCVTKEISDFLTPKLDARAREHYSFNHALLNPLLYMELRGIRYATEKAQQRRAALVAAGYAEQVKLDKIAGTGCQTYLNNVQGWLTALSGNCAKKYIYSTFDDLTGAWLKKKKQGVEDWFGTHSARIIELSKKMPNLTDSEIGELSTLSYTHMNVDSNKQFQEYVYGKLALPTQWKKDPKTKEERPTTDYEALLKLAKITNHPVCRIGIDLRSIGTRAGMLGIFADPDGRIRCGYNVVGTETGRLSCYTSPTGSGYNLTTIPDYQNAEEAPGKICGDRDLFLADEGHWFFQCDLKGADGWTIGAHSKALGDPTMWDDLMGGVKPAMVLALGVRGLTKYLSPATPRDEIREACKQVKKTDWDYFASKICIWSSCYLAGPDLLRSELLQESNGKLVWSRADAVNFQKLIFYRYKGVKEWHRHMASRLSVEPAITAASGHRRVFFGRKDELLGQALAHEPQANTTYATNKAMYRLWHDPENRLRADTLDGSLIFKRRFPERDIPRNGCILRAEPLHQVHDALDGQFIKEDVEFAKRKIPQWFDNPVIIAGQKLVIPYDGGYGLSWGELKEGTI